MNADLDLGWRSGQLHDQRGLDASGVASGDENAFDRAFTEAGEFGFKAVFAGIEVAEAIAAILAGDAANGCAGCYVVDDNNGLRERDAVPISQLAVESAGVYRFGGFRLSADCCQNSEDHAEECNRC